MRRGVMMLKLDSATKPQRSDGEHQRHSQCGVSVMAKDCGKEQQQYQCASANADWKNGVAHARWPNGDKSLWSYQLAIVTSFGSGVSVSWSNVADGGCDWDGVPAGFAGRT